MKLMKPNLMRQTRRGFPLIATSLPFCSNRAEHELKRARTMARATLKVKGSLLQSHDSITNSRESGAATQPRSIFTETYYHRRDADRILHHVEPKFRPFSPVSLTIEAFIKSSEA